MDFDHSEKVQKLQARVSAFMDQHVYPNEHKFHAQVAEGDRWQPTQIVEELKKLARKEGLWNLFLPQSKAGAGSHQHGIRAAVRDHGASALGARSVQLLGTGYRQHGDAGALRQCGAEEAVARALAPR